MWGFIENSLRLCVRIRWQSSLMFQLWQRRGRTYPVHSTRMMDTSQRHCTEETRARAPIPGNSRHIYPLSIHQAVEHVALRPRGQETEAEP